MSWTSRAGCRAERGIASRRIGVFLAGGAVLAGSVVGERGLSAQATYTVFTPTPSVSSSPSPSRQPGKRGERVSLVLHDSTLEYAVGEIVRQARMRVLYDSSRTALAKRISVRLGRVTVEQALTTVLKGTGLGYTVASDGETIVVGARGKTGNGERLRTARGIVTGRVTDSTSGKGVSGATVLVTGTSLRTTTADNGHFVLRDVPAGDRTLTVRAFGYKPTTQLVAVSDSGQSVTRIVLTSTPTVLSGVVTTASGVQQRRQVGNDITVLNADSVMRTAPVATLTDLLETRVPGLIVMRTSGVPGAPSRLRLRGTSSIERSNDPIFIVDGIRMFANPSNASNNVLNGTYTPAPSPIDQIDPNSIQTIEVFKGPSAAALYGADAGNGVIVITTKRGQGGRTRWNLALETGRSSLPGTYPTNFFKFGHPFNVALSSLCDPYDGTCIQDSLVTFQALNAPRLSPIGRGATRSASLTVSGGSGALTYSVTGSGSDDQGILKLPAFVRDQFEQQQGFAVPGWMRRPSWYRTWGGNSRVDIQLGRPGGAIALTSSLFRSVQQQSDVQTAISALQGRYIDTSFLASNDGLLAGQFFRRVRNGAWTTTNGVTMTWPVRSWLPLTATGGINAGTIDNTALVPRGYRVGVADSVGTYSLDRGSSNQQTFNVGTVVRVPGVGRVPGVRLPVGLNLTNETITAFSAFTSDIPVGVSEPTTLVYPDGGGPTQTSSAQSTYGWYVAPTFDVDARFFVSPGIRFDGGSASGKNAGLSGFSPFPKLDFSWLAIDRADAPVLGAIALLRPRVAFGIAGVQPGPASKLRLFRANTATIPNTTPTSDADLVALGNTQLRPERSREFEGGVDAELWNQRLTVTLTGYQKLRYDAILGIPVAPSVIGDNQTVEQNIGTVRNEGFDATIGTRLLDRRLATWNVNANVHKNTNRVLSLAPGFTAKDVTGSGTELIKPGYPLYGRWARPIKGFADADHDGVISPGEVVVADSAVYVGAQEPNYELTVSTTLSLFNGRLSVSTAADYQNGMTQLNCGGGFGTVFDPTLTPGQQAAIAAGNCGSVGTVGTEYGVIQSVNTLRWTTLSVLWQAPAGVARRAGVAALSVALQGSNLGLRTNYRGKDPNVNAFAYGDRVMDNGQLPQPRAWQLRVTFGN